MHGNAAYDIAAMYPASRAYFQLGVGACFSLISPLSVSAVYLSLTTRLVMNVLLQTRKQLKEITINHTKFWNNGNPRFPPAKIVVSKKGTRIPKITVRYR